METIIQDIRDLISNSVSTKVKILLALLLIFILDLIVYLLTLSPTLQFIDSGELAVVCKTLGIAHPTGYPLYTLLGRLFSLLPWKDIIFRVNFMSLFFICSANLILFSVFLVMEKDLKKRNEKLTNMDIWSALLATLIFSFTPTLWSQATSNEVYALNVLFFGLIMLLVLLWKRRWKEYRGDKIFYLLIFVYALSFGNHMSTLLLLPALIFIFISAYGKNLFQPKRLILIFVLFLLGLSIYFFLPIRSSQNPVMDWGNPQSWVTFKRQVTGWQYQVWMFAESTDTLVANLKSFIKLFFHQFPWYLLPLSLLGMYRLFVHDRKILIFLLIFFLVNVFYGINYVIPDIDPYFLGAFLVNAVFIGSGLNFIFRIIENSKLQKFISQSLIILFILLPLISLKKNYFEADRSRDHFAYDFATNLMRSIKKDAVLMTNVWDHYSPWLYLRFVELKRPDINYLDVELCRRSWYFNFIRQNYPDLYRTSESEITKFVREVYPFENRRTFNPQIIENAYTDMLNSFLARNFQTRPLYDDLIGESRFEKLYLKNPEGMAYSLKDSLRYYPYDFPNLEIRGIMDHRIYKDDRTLFNLNRYPFMIDARLKYLSYFKWEGEVEALQRRYEKLLKEPIR
jgi:hypothetical protein